MEVEIIMKYNIYEIMIALSFVCFCFDYTPILLLGLLLLMIGGIYVIHHQDEYDDYEDFVEYEECEEYAHYDSKKIKKKKKGAA